MEDTKGRKYARLGELTEGDVVQVDDGFTCIPQDQFCVVQKKSDELYLCCAHGKHYLDGQLADDDDSLIGIYRI